MNQDSYRTHKTDPTIDARVRTWNNNIPDSRRICGEGYLLISLGTVDEDWGKICVVLIFWARIGLRRGWRVWSLNNWEVGAKLNLATATNEQILYLCLYGNDCKAGGCTTTGNGCYMCLTFMYISLCMYMYACIRHIVSPCVANGQRTADKC